MEAFGEMGILPKDFYPMRYEDFILMHQGFINKRRYEQRLLRRAIAMLLQPHTKKGHTISEYQIWPVDGDKKIMAEEKEQRKQSAAHVSEESLKILQQFKMNPDVNMNEVFKQFKDKEKDQKSKDN